MTALNLNGKKVLVMGLGRFGGGIGLIHYLCQQGAQVTVTDLKDEIALAESRAEIKDLSVQLHLGRHDVNDFTQADIVCVSPAVAPGNQYVEQARQAGVVILTAMGIFFSTFPGRIIGITGSNGKSTTTRLIYEMLKPLGHIHIGGNIGGSLLPDLSRMTAEDSAVLELSSFQLYRLRELQLSPTTAVITNITPNHLDWHGTKEEYIQAKAGITAFQSADDTLVYNAADPVTAELAAAAQGRLYAIPAAEDGMGVFQDGEAIMFTDGLRREFLFTAGDLQLPGEFNLHNAMLAAGTAFLHGADSVMIRAALQSFTGLPHRLEYCGTVSDIRFYNDSVATTPESVCVAVKAFQNKNVCILGGYDKKIDLSPMVDAVGTYSSGAVCIGTTGPGLAAELGKKFPAIKTAEADTITSAVEQALRIARDKNAQAVLLSPGCASYDMFNNFEERGRAFMETVAMLKERDAE